ncbi:hypothetical protein GCM10027047_15440 [Rhodococcus aerolatus]
MSTPPRVRVVLAEPGGPRRLVRTRAEVEEQTEVGDLLVRSLLRSQLGLAARLGLPVLGLLVALPLVWTLLPAVAQVRLLGVPLPWLVLGVAVHPLLVGVGWLHTRLAERTEADFADLVDD